MPKAQLCEVESTNKALDCPDRIVRPDIILDPRWKKTGLLTALAALECAIRHKQNRTSTPKNAEFLPSLDGQITQKSVQPVAQKYCARLVGQISDFNPRVSRHMRGGAGC